MSSLIRTNCSPGRIERLYAMDLGHMNVVLEWCISRYVGSGSTFRTWNDEYDYDFDYDYLYYYSYDLVFSF